MNYNKIQVAFGALRKITGPFISYQYDVQQILVINGLNLPEYYEVDFCNEGDTYTETIVGTSDGVAIPNKFLRTGKKVKAYLVLVGDGDVQTRYEITLPVSVRPQRQDIDPTDEQQLQIDALVAALNSGVAKVEEAVEHYPKITDGYWYVWDGDAGEYVSTDIKAEGTDGTDGVSPTVTIVDITGGHRITITDEDHPTGQSFDVLNGTDGDDGYPPAVTITTITGGHRVTITDKDHPQGQSFDVLDGQGGGGGTSDYTKLSNKPQINGHTLDGNQSAADLGLGTYSKPASGIPKTDLASDVQASLGKADTALQTAPVQSVAGKTGAVTLGAGDIGYDGTETYQAGSVGAELQEQNRQLSDVEENQIPELKNAIDAKQDTTNYVTLSGTIVTQTGADNTMYLCGELAELTFTAPATGQTAIRFTSGTTPTVATFSGVTWLNGFDPTAIEASKTYEINILNGLGCAAWT